MRESYDEILMETNPRGGRPMGLGTLLFRGSDTVDVSRVDEATTVRYHLGYCACGRRIVVGRERAAAIVAALRKRGLLADPDREPFRVRLGKRLLKSYRTF